MNDDRHDAILNFLTDGLPTKERDIITRSYFGLAQGDPESAPVQIAVLFNACTRKLAQAPAEIRDANENLKWMLDEGKKYEHRVIERTDKLNANVIAVFKDEASRTSSNLRATHQLNELTLKEAREMVETTRAANVHAEALATTLRLLHNDFQEHNVSVQKLARATENIQTIHQSTNKIVLHLSTIACVNWVTVGVVIGCILAIVAAQVPGWAALALYVFAIGLLQAVGRWSWKYMMGEVDLFPPDKG